MAVSETDADAIVVMDSDGEDRLEDISRLLAATQGRSGFTIVARCARPTKFQRAPHPKALGVAAMVGYAMRLNLQQ